jgi:site-specific recombinase XerD
VSTHNRKATRGKRLNLRPFITGCLTTQKTFGLSGRSLKELSIHLESLRLFCKNAGLCRIEQLTPQLLRAFLDLHAPRGKTHLKLVVWTLRTFGSYLALMQYLPDSPARELSHPVLRRREKLPRFLKPQELAALLDRAVQHHDLREAAVIMILCSAGLRPREVTLLRPQHVNPLRKVIAVTVKGGWLRLLPIANVLAEALQEYIQEYGLSGDTALFLNEWGRPIDVRWIERLVRRVAREAGIRRTVTPCMLRHTFATYMADRHGKTITRAFLGHGASASTDAYMHVVPSSYRTYMNMHPHQTLPMESADEE